MSAARQRAQRASSQRAAPTSSQRASSQRASSQAAERASSQRVRASSQGVARVIVDRLRAYADRGVFRRWGVRELGRGRLEARFLWHAPDPHRLVIDPSRRTLTFVDLLPEVGYPSAMDRALRAFLDSRFSEDLPEHRRLDPRRVVVRAVNRRGSVSIELRSKRGDPDYAAERLVKLVNEIFFSFLAGPYEEYMVRHFGAPEE